MSVCCTSQCSTYNDMKIQNSIGILLPRKRLIFKEETEDRLYCVIMRLSMVYLLRTSSVERDLYESVTRFDFNPDSRGLLSPPRMVPPEGLQV